MENKQPKHFLAKLSSSRVLSSGRVLLFAAIITVVGGVMFLYSSSAATLTVRGRVYDTRTNKGVAGVVILGCNKNGKATTNSTGYWSFTAVSSGYCARVVSGIPSGWSGPATYNRPEHAGSKTYEFQHAGMNCYHNTSCTNTPNEQTWDRSTDTGVDFRYTTPAPPTIKSFSPSPSTVTVGGSSKLSWVSNGTACSLAHGSTHLSVAASGNATFKLNSTTSFNLTCSNISGNSSPKSLTVTVKAAAKKSSPSKSTTSSGSGSGSRNSTSGKAKPDTTPPSTPAGLTANEDNATKTVKLNWRAATDNVGIAGYKVERSTDDQTWTSLRDNITGTSFSDPVTDFGTLYYYQIKAVDKAGNSSGYTETHITTSAFQSNTTQDSNATVTSDDKVATITIPAGILSADAFCSVSSADGVLPPNISGYVNITGPYQLNCRDSNGQPITNFNGALALSVQLNSSMLKGVGNVKYFGQNSDGSWQALEIQSHDKKSLTDTVKLDSFTTFSVMGQKSKHSIWLTLIVILILLVLAFFGIRLLLRFILTKRLEQQAEKLNDDYRHKSGGY